MQFDEVSTKAKEHQVETVLVITGVGVLGYLYYQRKLDKQRQHELELAKILATVPARERRRYNRLRRKHRISNYV